MSYRIRKFLCDLYFRTNPKQCVVLERCQMLDDELGNTDLLPARRARLCFEYDLLARTMPSWVLQHKGLFDPRLYDVKY